MFCWSAAVRVAAAATLLRRCAQALTLSRVRHPSQSCAERYQDHPYWMSSTQWALTMAQAGIFATDGTSPWGNANRIFLKYCSSDFWSGDVGASPASFNYNFRGSRIVAATITDLLTTQGMGSTPGAQLLFSGCSAGAIGAMNNLDAVAAQLPPSVTMRGMLDAAALLDITPTGWSWSNQLETLQSLMQQVVSIVQPVFPQVCLDAFPGESYKCLVGCVAAADHTPRCTPATRCTRAARCTRAVR